MLGIEHLAGSPPLEMRMLFEQLDERPPRDTQNRRSPDHIDWRDSKCPFRKVGACHGLPAVCVSPSRFLDEVHRSPNAQMVEKVMNRL